MMSEEKFFNQFKTTLHDYAPEVPAGVYAGMRRKLWWSNFTRFSFGSLNMWYILALVAVGTSATIWSTSKSATAKAQEWHMSPVDVQAHQVAAESASQSSNISCATVGHGSGSAVCDGWSPARLNTVAENTGAEQITTSSVAPSETVTAARTETITSAAAEDATVAAVTDQTKPAEEGKQTEKKPSGKPKRRLGIDVIKDNK